MQQPCPCQKKDNYCMLNYLKLLEGFEGFNVPDFGVWISTNLYYFIGMFQLEEVGFFEDIFFLDLLEI